jgi:uncharacterized protein YlxP (DUF503 family)
MLVGIQRLTFHIASSENSGKGLSQRIKDRLWSHFKVSVAEVEEPGGTELVLGVAFVGISEDAVQQKADSIVRHLNDWPAVELIHDEKDIVRYEDLEIERDFEKYNP